MNSTPLEDQVHDALHRRVDPLEHSPLTVTDVRRRARRIQRRRTIAAGAAVAAALAVAVPVGLAMNGPAQRTELPPVTRTPQVTGPVRIDPRSASIGEPPAVTLVDTSGPSLTTGGETVGIPSAYEQITPYRDGWIATVKNQGVTTVHVLDNDFGVMEYVDDTSALTVADDGSRVAYAYYDGIRWIIVDNDPTGERAEETTPLPDGPLAAMVRTVGFLPDGELVAAQVVDTNDGTEKTFVVTAEGATEPIPGFTQAVSASPATGMVAGLVNVTGAESCSAVVDGRARTGAEVWGTCNQQLGPFSPDGQHLVGLADIPDGPSPTLTVLDATTGDPAIDFEVTPARDRVVGIAQVVWEDDETLLATYTDGNQQYVVRLRLDGTVERVAGPVTNDDFTESLRLTPGRVG
jgi:hypothetical protein